MDIVIVIAICLINIPIMYFLTKKYFGGFANLSHYIRQSRYNSETRAGLLVFIVIIFLIVFTEIILVVNLLM